MIDDLTRRLNNELISKYGNKPSIYNIIDALLDTALITPTTIRDYNIKLDFKDMQAKGLLSDVRIRWELSDKYRISENMVYKVITNYNQ